MSAAWPWGGAQGQASDIDIQAKELLRMRDQLNGILARHTGRTLDEIARDTERDYYLSGEEARDYGLVDVVSAERPRPGTDGSGASHGANGSASGASKGVEASS